MRHLRVRDLMTSEVVAVSPDDPIAAIQDLMTEKQVRHVPVVDEGGMVVGLVSDRDMLRRTFAPDADMPLSLRRDVLSSIKVRQVMTWEIDTVAPGDEVSEAARLMLENKYGCLPVVEDGWLVGILTEADFVRFVADSRAATEKS